MTDARASLAAGIWDVVTLSLRHSFTDSPVTPVVQSLRYKLPMDLIYRLMDLDIQRILPQSQEQAVRPLETPFHTDDSFHSYERKVWYVVD